MSEPYDPLSTQIMPRFVILNFRKFFFPQEKKSTSPYRVHEI